MYEIHKGIAIPEKARKRPKYPFNDMEIDDCFFVPGKRPDALATVTAVAKKRTGFNFTCRTVLRCLVCKTIGGSLDLFCKTCDKVVQEKEVEKGVGIWRTE